MTEPLTPKDREILTEWKRMLADFEHAKKALRDVLNRHGVASAEFSSARIDFEMIKEEFDNFERKHHRIIDPHK